MRALLRNTAVTRPDNPSEDFFLAQTHIIGSYYKTTNCLSTYKNVNIYS